MKSASLESRKSRTSRLEVPLSERLNKRLECYAAAASAAGVGSRTTTADAAKANLIKWAASAAGVGLVLTGGPASAHIVYTPAYTVVPASFSTIRVPLDLNHDGINDFSFVNLFQFSSPGLTVRFRGDNAILGNKVKYGSCKYPYSLFALASALPAGHRIGPGNVFGAYGLMWAAAPGAATSCFGAKGHWFNVSGRFLGLELSINGEKHFGWARLNVAEQCDACPISATLTGYAYETVPGKPIRAGETGPAVGDAQPPARQPATLGLLARGSAGLDMWRKDEDTALGG